MKPTHPTIGKIVRHAQGLGVPTQEIVEQRAQELALIDGREEATDADLQRAWLELHGGHHDAGDLSEEAAMLTSISDRDMVAISVGRRADPHLPEGSYNLGEELVAEGIDEAAHDQMLSARHEIDLVEGED